MSSLAHFGEMLWVAANTAHFYKHRTFDLLPYVNSSAVFTTLTQSSLASDTRFSGPLLCRFSGAFDFFRLSNAFTESTGVTVVASADLQISKHF